MTLFRACQRKLLNRVNGVINGNPDYCLRAEQITLFCHRDENHFREIILKSSAADECYAATITHPVRAIPYTATINIVILQSFADIHLCAIINYNRRVVTFF